jgi:hypothetical protein
VSTTPLALSNLVDISVSVAPAAPVAPSFNQGLFIGNSGIIPSYGTNPRLRQYASTSAVLTDGFTTSDPEYIAAQIYFSQTPAPQFIWLGCQDTTALQTITINAAGTLWAVGDQFNIVASGGTHGVGTVTAETGGIPSAVAIAIQGTGYAVEAATTTAISPSTGTGLTLHITAIGETLLQAAVACRAAGIVWYGLSVYNPADADNIALSEWADPLWQNTRYYNWSPDVAIANGTTGNVALQLQALSIRTLGIYSTTQGGTFPNNIFAAVGLMGIEAGLNTGLANSFFDLAHKQIAGIAPEPISQTQYTNILTANWGVYGNFGGVYNFYEPGFMSNGAPSFLWLFLAMLVANIQLNELAVFAGSPAVAQTNADEQKLINAANQACAYLASIGFIASGIWEGNALPVPSANNPGLVTGQALPSGYICLASPYSQQSTSDRDAGKAMPIYVAITTAGAVQSLLIGVNVQL